MLPTPFPNTNAFSYQFPLHSGLRTDLQSWIAANSTVPFLLVGESGCGKTTLLVDFICHYYGITETEVSAHFARGMDSQFNLFFFHSYQSECIADVRAQLNTFCPVRCSFPNRKKIVVVDDADTLPEPMQQILCGYMDKYENSVLFIGSCSSPRMLTDRFQSRFLQLQLEPVACPQMKDYIQWEATRHAISLEPDAVSFLSRVCHSHLKCAQQCILKLALFQWSPTPTPHPISLSTVISVCSFIAPEVWKHILDAARKQDTTWMDATRQLMALVNAGHSLPDIYTSFVDYLKFHLDALDASDASDASDVKRVTFAEYYECIAVACRYMSTYYRETESECMLLLFANDLHNIMANHVGLAM